MFKKNIVITLISILFAVVLYNFYEVIKTSSIRSVIFGLGINILLCIFLYIRKQDKVLIVKKAAEFSILGTLFFVTSILVSSILFRGCFYLREGLNTFSLYSFLSDFYVVRYFLGFLILYPSFIILKSVFVENSKNNSRNISALFYFIISFIGIIFMAFVWGWVPELHNFPGLEVLYIFNNSKDISYDPSYLIIAVVFSPLVLVGLRHYASSILKESTKRSSGVFVSLLVMPIILFGLCATIGPLRAVYYHSLLKDTNGSYTHNYNLLLKNTNLSNNPIMSFFEKSFNEYLRIKSFGMDKRMITFFNRPKVELDDGIIRAWMNKILNRDETMPSSKFPGYRVKKGTNSEKKYNVVVIVLETFETNDSDSFKGRGTPYKFLRELEKNSVSCAHGFANSEASYEGESAISSSLPIWGTVSVKESGMITNSYNRSYLKILKDRGYYSEFSTTWNVEQPLISEQLKNSFLAFGFNEKLFSTKVDYYTYPFLVAGIQNISPLFDKDLKKEILDPNIHQGDEKAEKPNGMTHGVWYVHDDYSYEKLYNKMVSATNPFFIVTHTESSHTKFPIPYGYRPEGSMSDEDRFFYSASYADTALKKFFTRIKEHPIYKDTIFILVSDHTSIKNTLSLYDRYHIPIIFHAPHLITPQRIDEPAFQVDIGPTLLEILGFGGEYTSFGKNLYKNKVQEKRGMILPNWNGYLVFVNDPYIAKVDVDKVYEMYNFRKDKYKNLVDDPLMQEELNKIHNEFLITYRIFGDSLFLNRVYPRDLVE